MYGGEFPAPGGGPEPASGRGDPGGAGGAGAAEGGGPAGDGPAAAGAQQAPVQRPRLQPGEAIQGDPPLIGFGLYCFSWMVANSNQFLLGQFKPHTNH